MAIVKVVKDGFIYVATLFYIKELLNYVQF